MKVTLRQMLRRNRLLRMVYQAALGAVHRPNACMLSRRLSNHASQRAIQLGVAVRTLYWGADSLDRQWVRKIERVRSQLLRNDGRLVDHTLEVPRLYDGAEWTVKDVAANSKSPGAARFLYCLVRALESRCVLELGTNVGISSAYLASALDRVGAGGGLITLDASPYRQRLAVQNHERLGLPGITYVQGLFADTLDSVLAECGEIDLAFIDGHHLYQPTLDYLNAIIPHASGDCVFVFDDIRWSDGMQRAWTEIRTDPRFGLVLDLQSVGLCVLGNLGESQRIVEGPVRIF